MKMFLAVLVIALAATAAVADDDPYQYHVNYYDANGTMVGYWRTGCGHDTVSGTTTNNFRVTRMHVCSPTWIGANTSCYIDGGYYSQCPVLPSDISTMTSPFTTLPGMDPCPKENITTLGHTCCVYPVDANGGCSTGPNP
jgi:hypothetical protein